MYYQLCYRGFSAARLADDSGHLPLPCREADIIQNLFLVVCEINIFQFHVKVIGEFRNISRPDVLCGVEHFKLLYSIIHLRKHREEIYYSCKGRGNAQIQHHHKYPGPEFKRSVKIKYRSHGKRQKHRAGHARIYHGH